MHACGYFLHYNPETSRKNGYINIAEEAIAAYVQNKPHYKSIINPGYTYIGIGVPGGKVVEYFRIAKSTPNITISIHKRKRNFCLARSHDNYYNARLPYLPELYILLPSNKN